MEETVIEFMKKNRVVAVIRSASYEKSLEFARGCVDGGIRIIEIISISPGSEKLLRELASEDGICVGAGTVLDRDSAERMSGCGARFIVSPHHRSRDNRVLPEKRHHGGLRRLHVV